MIQPLEDRIPTAAEVRAVDPVAAWARMTPEQRDAIGPMLMKYIATSGALLFVRTTEPEKGWGEYTPEQIRQSLWAQEDYDAIECDSESAFEALSDEMDKYFPQAFGWTGGDL